MITSGTALRDRFILHGHFLFHVLMNLIPQITGTNFPTTFLSARTISGDMGWILRSSPLILRLMTIFIEFDGSAGLLECLYWAHQPEIVLW